MGGGGRRLLIPGRSSLCPLLVCLFGLSWDCRLRSSRAPTALGAAGDQQKCPNMLGSSLQRRAIKARHHLRQSCRPLPILAFLLQASHVAIESLMQTEAQLTPLWSERQEDNVVGANVFMLRSCSTFLTCELLRRLLLQPQTPWLRDESIPSAVEGMRGYPPGWVVVPNQSYIDWSILCAALCEKDTMVEQYGAFNGEGYEDFLASRTDFSLRGEHTLVASVAWYCRARSFQNAMKECQGKHVTVSSGKWVGSKTRLMSGCESAPPLVTLAQLKTVDGLDSPSTRVGIQSASRLRLLGSASLAARVPWQWRSTLELGPRQALVLLAPTVAIDRRDLDATDEEYAEVLEAAGGLADETYPRTQHFTEEAISVANVDIAQVMTARALSRYGDANPDPCLPVPSRQALVVVRRSLHLAGRPAQVDPPPAATIRRTRPVNEDAEEPARKRRRKDRAERPGEALATPPTFSYRTIVVVPVGSGSAAREACEDGGKGSAGGVGEHDAAGASDSAACFGSEAAAEGQSPVVGERSSRRALATSSRAADGDGATAIDGHVRLLDDELAARELASGAEHESRPSGAAAGAAMSWAPGPEARITEQARDAPVRRKSRSKRRKNGPRPSQQKAASQGRLDESPEPGPEYEYHVASFTEDDISCKPTPQPAYAPPPPPPPCRSELGAAAASRPTHHSPAYRVRRVQEYRSLLPLEVIQPAVVLDANERPSLAVERLNRTVPGWRGFIPRLRIASVRKEWGTARLKEVLKELKIVPYAGLNTAISDMSGRTVFYRATPFREHKGEDVVEAFAADSYRFAAACPIKAGDRRHNPRGKHYACIMGVHRQYAKEAYYTRFHRKYNEQIDWYFRENGPASQITRYLTAMIDTRFPGVSERMRRNHAWHYERTIASGMPFEPQFGLFWNYCINLPSPEDGVPRVFTYPHTDCMNCAVLLCAIFVFWEKGWVGEDEWSFLVVWELGVIVECPRRVVKCKRGESPTPSSTQELPKTAGFPIGGRGSGVWFTQASMHSHTSERDSKGRLPDYEGLARQRSYVEDAAATRVGRQCLRYATTVRATLRRMPDELTEDSALSSTRERRMTERHRSMSSTGTGDAGMSDGGGGVAGRGAGYAAGSLADRARGQATGDGKEHAPDGRGADTGVPHGASGRAASERGSHEAAGGSYAGAGGERASMPRSVRKRPRDELVEAERADGCSGIGDIDNDARGGRKKSRLVERLEEQEQEGADGLSRGQRVFMEQGADQVGNERLMHPADELGMFDDEPTLSMLSDIENFLFTQRQRWFNQGRLYSWSVFGRELERMATERPPEASHGAELHKEISECLRETERRRKKLEETVEDCRVRISRLQFEAVEMQTAYALLEGEHDKNLEQIHRRRTQGYGDRHKQSAGSSRDQRAVDIEMEAGSGEASAAERSEGSWDERMETGTMVLDGDSHGEGSSMGAQFQRRVGRDMSASEGVEEKTEIGTGTGAIARALDGDGDLAYYDPDAATYEQSTFISRALVKSQEEDEFAALPEANFDLPKHYIWTLDTAIAVSRTRCTANGTPRIWGSM
ncbi:hypothetical protein AURDEDRAFT_124923 [Auricularia subglabra TFB-10046 SS5]|nr:hypothetical protein AURDEDRAFT_124923 [Auricularia subglabra TFB-10046 SS5]